MRAATILVCGVLAACVSRPTCPIAAPSAIAQPFVWEARGPDGVIVLVGLHSAASPGDLPARVWTALDRSDVYVAETDEVPPRLEVPLALLRFPDDVHTPLSADERSELADLLGANPDYVARSRLWVLFMRLGETAYKFPAPTLNAALRSRARRQRIAMQFFEDWFAQARFFDASITRAKLVAAMHGFPKLACEIDRRVVAFRAGEDAVFVNHIADPTDPIVARIERWLAQLEQLARIHHRMFVAVGVSELLGPYGLVARLEAKGYRMQRGLSAP
jgi:uncharacterized protein YbaP (TraB family)